MRWRALALVGGFAVGGWTRGLDAQVVNLNTVPLAAGNQFDIFPATNLGMGGASIAISVPLLDLFQNPAKGIDSPAHIFTAPTAYSVSDGSGGARSLPIGIYLHSDTWFGGGMVATQEVDIGPGFEQWIRPMAPGDQTVLPNPWAFSDASAKSKRRTAGFV